MSRKNWGLFLLTGLLWGIPYLLMKVAVKELSPVVIVFSRVFIGSLILIPLAIRKGTLRSAFKNWKYVIPYAIAEMIIPWILITSAEKHITSGLAGLLVATVPIWSTIQASYHGDKTVWHRKRLFGLALGFIGIVLVVGIESISGKQNPIAIGAMIVAAMGYSWATIMVNRYIPQVDGIAINGMAMGLTSIFYLPLALINLPTQMPQANVIWSVVLLGLFPTALAFILFFQLMPEIGPARASLVTYLNTAFAVLLGVVLLGEPLTLGIEVGLPLVLVGSYFASRKNSAAEL
jgi:drug/metabolite transporter (DMT)-like permease